jgi:hypothetical protein
MFQHKAQLLLNTGQKNFVQETTEHGQVAGTPAPCSVRVKLEILAQSLAIFTLGFHGFPQYLLTYAMTTSLTPDAL